jgi:hypothetical protein
LLTGRTPFDAQELLAVGYDAVMWTIREEDPPKPSTRLSTLTKEERSGVATRRHVDPAKLERDLRGDLDWIVMKALVMDRTRRYDSVHGLAADLLGIWATNRCWLDRRAPPPGSKAWRRNKVVFAAAVVAFAALALGIAFSTW